MGFGKKKDKAAAPAAAQDDDNPFKKKPEPAGSDVEAKLDTIEKARRATVMVETKGKEASKTNCCLRFALAVRMYMFMLGAGLLGMAFMVLILAALNLNDASSTCDGGAWVGGGGEGSCRFAVDQGISFIGIAIWLILFGGLLIAAELRARCLARYFGFLCTTTGKGLFLFFCATVLTHEGLYFKHTGNSIGAAAAELALFIVGLMHVGGGVLQLCCGCCLPADPLKKEFADYATALKQMRSGGAPGGKKEGKEKEKEASAATEEVDVVVETPQPAARQESAEENPFKKKPAAAGDERSSQAASAASTRGSVPATTGLYPEPVGDENPFRKPRPGGA